MVLLSLVWKIFRGAERIFGFMGSSKETSGRRSAAERFGGRDDFGDLLAIDFMSAVVFRRYIWRRQGNLCHLRPEPLEDCTPRCSG